MIRLTGWVTRKIFLFFMLSKWKYKIHFSVSFMFWKIFVFDIWYLPQGNCCKFDLFLVIFLYYFLLLIFPIECDVIPFPILLHFVLRERDVVVEFAEEKFQLCEILFLDYYRGLRLPCVPSSAVIAFSYNNNYIECAADILQFIMRPRP